MVDQSKSLPDLQQGVPLSHLKEGVPLLGLVGRDEVMVVKHGSEIYAVSATCTHYGGPLNKGLLVGSTVHCPWHHAIFDLSTGLAVGAPALRPLGCYPVEVDGQNLRLHPKAKPSPPRAPRKSPASVVMVGAGAAAAAAAEMLRQEGYQGPITMLGLEESGPVDRPNLSKGFLAGHVRPNWIPLGDTAHWQNLKVDIHTGLEVTAIDRDQKEVHTATGDIFEYDCLLLATGAEPVVPPIPGLEKTNHFTLRSYNDSKAIVEAAEENDTALIVGASFIGLEVAASLRTRGVDVTVVAPEDIPLAKALGSEIGRFIKSVHQGRGVNFYLGTSVQSFEEDRATLTDGTIAEFDFVVLGTGVRPRTKLASDAGLDVNNGVIVDEFLRTNDPNIYAAGDIARFPDPINKGSTARIEHWVLAERHGQQAARNMLGIQSEKGVDIPFFWSRHYNFSVKYVGNGQGYDRTIIKGDINAKDAIVAYFNGDRITAVATLGRDLDALRAEYALAIDDQQTLYDLVDYIPFQPSPPAHP